MIKVPDVGRIVKLISEINHIYPEEIEVYRVKSKELCPRNHYDPVRGLATDINCPVCGGKGFVYTYEAIKLPANIDYPSGMRIEFLEPGVALLDRLYITIDKREIDLYQLEPADIAYIIYDGHKYIVKQYRRERLENYYYELMLEVERVSG